MDWWFDIVGPIWLIIGAIGIFFALLIWLVPGTASNRREREYDIRAGAIVFLAALVAPLTIVALVIYGLIWLVRTALGK
jgi:NADH:ubiquinone oxidoreductase subunit 6 (subunit J)